MSTVSYQVFRNVKDFGAKGDGVTDDTEAINQAISSGGRCGQGCNSTTTSTAVVYFPSGKYLITAPIIPFYYTQLIGDARRPPTIIGAANFEGMALIDADPYIPGANGAQYWINQNNFFRSVRNFVLDTTMIPANNSGTGIHWQVSQSTSLMNILFKLSNVTGNVHQGIFMENGSGGFMGDLVFSGGKYGMWVGNQQFTVRNVTFNNVDTAIFQAWNWGWTFQGVRIKNCQIGFDLLTGGLTQDTQTVGADAIIDAVVENTPIFVRNSQASNHSLAGSLVLNNIKLVNVSTAVGVVNGSTPVLAGGTRTIKSWGQGNIYKGSSPTGSFQQGNIVAPTRPHSLLDASGWIFGKSHPQYESYAVSQFVSVRSEGAKGDGKTDDTAALKAIFAKYAGCKIIFFDAGTYVVSSTITFPAGSRTVGEGWSVIAGKGAAFQNPSHPKPVVSVGSKGSKGIVEITDMIFTTVGPAPGAIVVEWNIAQFYGRNGQTGMWDSHIRLGGAVGTHLQASQCPATKSNYSECTAAFLALHLTPGSTAYLEGTWVWLADHDLDVATGDQVSLYSGRGILSQSQGPVWMIGTGAEHHAIYQYSLVGAKNHYMGLIQTETPYYQPSPAAPTPFVLNKSFSDPPAVFRSAWGLHITRSSDILIFGAGLYSFYQNYTQDCLLTTNCQDQILNIDQHSSVNLYSLSTVGTVKQLSIAGKGVIDQSKNVNGFASTVTAWSK